MPDELPSFFVEKSGTKTIETYASFCMETLLLSSFSKLNCHIYLGSTFVLAMKNQFVLACMMDGRSKNINGRVASDGYGYHPDLLGPIIGSQDWGNYPEQPYCFRYHNIIIF